MNTFDARMLHATGRFSVLLKSISRLTARQRESLRIASQIGDMDAVAAVIDELMAVESRCPHCGTARAIRWGSASGLPRFRCKFWRRTFNPLRGLDWPACVGGAVGLRSRGIAAAGRIPRGSGRAMRDSSRYRSSLAASVPPGAHGYAPGVVRHRPSRRDVGSQIRQGPTRCTEGVGPARPARRRGMSLSSSLATGAGQQ
jgi:hypothetical protein